MPRTSKTSTSKAKPRTRPTAKAAKARSKTKPLVAEESFVRTAAPRGKRDRATVASVALGPAVELALAPANPASAVIGLMGRLVQIYATFPIRLSRCTSPVAFWQEHTRLTQDVLAACHSATTDAVEAPAPSKKR